MGIKLSSDVEIVQIPIERPRPHVVAYQNLDPDWGMATKLVRSTISKSVIGHRALRTIYGDDYLVATEISNFPYWEDRDIGGGIFAKANECMQYRFSLETRGLKFPIPLGPLIDLGTLVYDYIKAKEELLCTT